MKRWVRASMVLGALATVAVCGTARAGGFEFPDNGTIALGRGGAFAARADDPTAIWYNPAGLAGLKGTRTLIDLNFPHLKVDFDRAGVDANGASLYPTASNQAGFGVVPMVVQTADFGLKNVTFALSLAPPSGIGSHQYDATGPQRYQMTSMESMMLLYGLTVGWRPHPRVDVGVSLQLAHMLKTRMSQVIDSWISDGAGPKDSSYDTMTHIEFDNALALGMLLGILVRPVDGLHIGLSVRPFPIHFNMQGHIETEYPGSYLKHLQESNRITVTNDSATMTQDLPIMGRLGIRYAHVRDDQQLFDIEADVVYEAWSIVKSFDVQFGGSMGFRQDIGGWDMHPLKAVSIPKNWKDTVSVRLGGDYDVIPGMLALRLGGFYESGASPAETTNLDFLSVPRFGVGTGFTFKIRGIDISFGYEHIFQLTRTVDVGTSLVHQMMPVSPCQPPYNQAGCPVQGQPPGIEVGAGTYRSGIDVLSAGISITWETLVGREIPTAEAD